MAYSNGYDQSAVITALKDRVGFRQPLGTGAPTLSSAVTTSNSGRYFQDFHALVTIDNIKASMYYPAASDANLIIYLGELRSAAIMRALNGVFTGKQIVDAPMKLFSRRGNNDELESNDGLFVGYAVKVADTHDAALQIESLELYFDSAVSFDVYVFADGNQVPKSTHAVTTVANKITTVDISELILGQGLYYIGYFQDDIGSAKAYRQQVDCWNRQLQFSATPMSAEATGATTFNREEISYTGEPVGINLSVSSFKDYTTAIKRKAAQFDELIGLTTAYSVLEQIIYCVRSNPNERILKEQLDRIGVQIDLNGVAPISDSPQVMGLKQRIERETEAVGQSFYPKLKAQVVCL